MRIVPTYHYFRNWSAANSQAQVSISLQQLEFSSTENNSISGSENYFLHSVCLRFSESDGTHLSISDKTPQTPSARYAFAIEGDMGAAWEFKRVLWGVSSVFWDVSSGGLATRVYPTFDVKSGCIPCASKYFACNMFAKWDILHATDFLYFPSLWDLLTGNGQKKDREAKSKVSVEMNMVLRSIRRKEGGPKWFQEYADSFRETSLRSELKLVVFPAGITPLVPIVMCVVFAVGCFWRGLVWRLVAQTLILVGLR